MAIRAVTTHNGNSKQCTDKYHFLGSQISGSSFEGLGPKRPLVGNVPLELRNRLVSL